MTTEERVIELWAEGKSACAIAHEVGWRTQRVFDFASKNRDKCMPRVILSTREEREEMRRMVREGVPVKQIARHIGVSETTVYRATRKLREKMSKR